MDTLIADARAHAHALSFEIGLQCHADLGVHFGQQAAAATDCDGNTEARKHLPQLDPDHAAADDQQGFRQALKRQSRSAGKVGNSVEPWNWRHSCARTHRQYDLAGRSEEHTSELQSLMRISYAVFCLKKKKQNTT